MVKMKNYEEIIEGCKRQDRKYQEILFKNFYPMLMPVSTRMAPDNATAEDLLQDAFIKIFEKIDTIDKNNIEVVFSWCKKVLTNIIIDYYRSKPHRLLPSINDIDDLIDDDVIDDDFNYLDSKNTTPSMIQGAITTLSPQYKLVFSLYAMEGYQHNEISEMLGISISTSKTNYMKARLHLRKKLDVCPVS